MAEIPVVQEARYAFLGYNYQQQRKRCCCLVPDKYMVFAMALSFFTFIIGAVYVTTVGVDQRLLLPKRSTHIPVPPSWVRRAITYNTFNQFLINGTEKAARITDTPYAYKLVCYYMFPSETRSHEDLTTLNVDPHLCTHLNLGFAKIVDDEIYLDDYQLEVARKTLNLRRVNGNLKVLLSIGGAGNESGYPEMVENHSRRKRFIQSILKHIRERGFDGVDLDWEFPAEQVRNDSHQKQHFTQLLREIRVEIERQEKHKFLLSVAVAAPVFMIDQAYDVAYMSEYVDYVNLMSYDYHYFTKFTPFTGLNAPLYHLPGEDDTYFATLNINASTNYWHRKGMDRRKIIVGLPTYGHSFRLMNQQNNGLGAPASGYGFLGTDGFVDYAHVCWFLQKNQIKPVFVLETFSPYATKYFEWVSFEDLDSLTYKTEFVKNHHYGGVMVLSLNTDDHMGSCEKFQKKQAIYFPLTRRIKNVLMGGSGDV